jgi:hypothetical protein
MLQHGCRRRTISAKEGVHGQRQDEVADLNGLGGQVADLHGPAQTHPVWDKAQADFESRARCIRERVP